jgi:hypothetical protein
MSNTAQRLIGLIARTASSSLSSLNAIVLQRSSLASSHLSAYYAPQISQIRHITQSSSLLSSLSNTLDAEIKEEETSYAKPPEVARGDHDAPPDP